MTALADGSYISVLFHPEHRLGYSRQAVIDAARAGKPLDPSRGMLVRVVDYDITDRSQLGPDGGEQGSECVTLITTILQPDGECGVDALALARTYTQRWEIETAFDLAKTHLRGPGRVLRSRLPELVTQEIWALLITHYALAAVAARAAEAAGIDPDRVSFDRLLHITRRSATGTAGFPPERWAQALPGVLAELTARPLPPRRHRSCPRAVKRARHNGFAVKKAKATSRRYDRPATVRLYAVAPPEPTRST